jgi:transposase
LRESVREGKKVRTRTLANLSDWAPERIEALRLALKGEFDHQGRVDVVPQCGEVFGVLFALKKIADELGISSALGKTPQAKLALFLVLARIAHQGSRLSAVRFARQHAAKEILGLEAFDEDDLYQALDWAAKQQPMIEKKLYREYGTRHGKAPALVLYDVTSSYLEGEKNELAAYGYNRDGKRGKKQIVIGLLASPEGEPLAVRVFQGNTADPATVATQINLLKEQFKIQEVIFVGDRGMVKTKGKEALTAETMTYITALTNPQIQTLLKNKVIQPSFFDEPLAEVEEGDKRYILRRNDSITRREAKRVEDKLKRLHALIDERNAVTNKSARTKAEKGLAKLKQWIKKYRLHKFVEVSLQGRTIICHVDEAAQAEDALLDGCYVLETDVKKDVLTPAEIDTSYRNLQQVERNFRTIKTGFLEVRPIFVRKKARTEGHVLLAMLALKITRALEEKLHQAFGTTQDDPYAPTLEDALNALSRFIFLRYEIKGKAFMRLPRPDDLQQTILNALGVSLPRQKQM